MKAVLKRKAAFVDKAVAFFLLVQAVFAASIFDAGNGPGGVSVDQKRQESLDPQAVVLFPDSKGPVWPLEGRAVRSCSRAWVSSSGKSALLFMILATWLGFLPFLAP